MFKDKMCWLDGEFESRCREDSSELFGDRDLPDRVGAGVRQILEDGMRIAILKENCVAREIVQRDPESVPYLDPEDKDEGERPSDSEDALDHVEVLETPRVPWDVVRWLEPRKDKEGKIVMVEESAPVFPKWPDRRPRGYASVLGCLVTNGKINGRQLYLAIRDSRKLDPFQVRRLWELYKIQKFVNSKSK